MSFLTQFSKQNIVISSIQLIHMLFHSATSNPNPPIFPLVISPPNLIPFSSTHAFSFTVTGPVARFARQISSHGYIVAAPSSYHEFTGPAPLAYDGPGTDQGNEWKIKKKLEAYDEDAKLSVDVLLGMKTCTGLVGCTGMCLGGHLAFR